MAAPHVALNALFLDPAASGGVETYLRGLAPALLRRRPELELSVVTTGRGAASLIADGWAAWARIVRMPCEEGQRGRRQWAEQVGLPVWALRRGVDLVHSLASVGPGLTPGVRHVVTLHDVTMFRFATFGALTTRGMRAVMWAAARDADALLAVTAWARDDVSDVLGLDPSRFVVAHHGREAVRVVRAAPEAEVRERYALGAGRVVLCVAAKRPHKNQELLVRALAHLPADVTLVLAGHAEGYEQVLRRLADELGVAGRVRFADWVPDADLEALWDLADCAAFPTRGEGFGLPVLDALDRGVPVACSDLPVLREVAGDAPRWFGPDDPEAAAAAIGKALEVADPVRRARGREHARGFTWDAAADRTLKAYDRALAG